MPNLDPGLNGDKWPFAIRIYHFNGPKFNRLHFAFYKCRTKSAQDQVSSSVSLLFTSGQAARYFPRPLR
jgi:hypothetical protein